MEWAQTPWYIFVVSAVVMPLAVEMFKKWQAMQQVKTLLALLVSCAVAAGGLLIDGKLTWETIGPSMGTVFTLGTVVYRMFFRNPDGKGSAVMKTMSKLIAPILLMTVVMGCQTMDPNAARLAEQSVAPSTASGRTSSEVSTNEVPAAPAVAWGASTANSTASTAKYSPTNSNANSGPVVTGFQLGAITEQKMKAREWLAQQIAEDIELKSIKDEIKYLMDVVEYSPELQARLDVLRKQARDATASLMVGLKESGFAADLNLASLTHLTVVAWISSNSGATERTPTEAEVSNLAKLLPDIVSAARGEGTIQGKADETTTE